MRRTRSLANDLLCDASQKHPTESASITGAERNRVHVCVFGVPLNGRCGRYVSPSSNTEDRLQCTLRGSLPPEGPAIHIRWHRPTLETDGVDGVVLENAFLYVVCELHDRVDNLEENSLLVGRVDAAPVQTDALGLSERENKAAIQNNPFLACLPPNRYATIDESNDVPFPAGFQK